MIITSSHVHTEEKTTLNTINSENYLSTKEESVYTSEEGKATLRRVKEQNHN